MIQQSDPSKTYIFLGESDPQIRTLLCSALRGIDLDVSDNFEEWGTLKLALQNSSVDLLIADADLPGGDTLQMAQDIRNGELGHNPFVPLILTTWKNDPQRIRTLIDSGVDGLLAKPISVDSIHMQLDTIINRRKPFVVTSSYIGPDRRKDPVRKSETPLIDVPNTICQKLRGKPVDPLDLQREIRGVQQNVRSERLRRNAFEMSFLVDLLTAEHAEDGGKADIGRFGRRLVTVAKDTNTRILESNFAKNAETCKYLIEAAKTVVASHPKCKSGDIALLKPLSDTILHALNPDRDAKDLADDIARSLAQFRERNATAKAKVTA